MKQLRDLILTIVFISAIAMNANYVPYEGTAEVLRVQGKYIFVDAEPVLDYEVLGTVKVRFTLSSGQYDPMKRQMVNKAYRKYPDADGYILRFADGGTDMVDAIKFY